MRSVLVVDDDPEFRKLAGRVLAAGGLAVVGEAGSVAAALAALPWRPQVVLTSVNPESTTTEAARKAGAQAFVVKG